jgi:hypothetical protein
LKKSIIVIVNMNKGKLIGRSHSPEENEVVGGGFVGGKLDMGCLSMCRIFVQKELISGGMNIQRKWIRVLRKEEGSIRMVIGDYIHVDRILAYSKKSLVKNFQGRQNGKGYLE